MVLSLVEIYFERQDGKQFGHIAPNGFDAPFFPRPNLRRDVIVGRNGRMPLQKLRNAEVKPRIIHQDNHIGMPSHNVAFALRHVAKNGAQMEQNGHETHIGQLAIVLHTCTANGLHLIATKETKLGFGIALPQSLHQFGGMQIAAGLAYKEIIFHVLR